MSSRINNKRLLLFNKIRTSYIACTLLILLASINPVVANEANISFNNISTEDNPDFAYILSLYQDSDGYMWIGTYNGLRMYDGINYSTFVNTFGQNSISNSVVHAIIEDDDKNLWFGTEYGLNKYNKQTKLFTVYNYNDTLPNSLQHDHIRTLYIDNKGHMWIGTYGGGLSIFDIKTETFSAITTGNSSLQSDRINCFLADNDSTFWVGTESGGLSIVQATTQSVSVIENIYFPKLTISEIFKDKKGNIWVGIWENGIYLFNRNNLTFSPQMTEIGTDLTALSIVEDIEGAFWIGTFNRGLVKYNSAEEYSFLTSDIDNPHSLPSNSVWKLFIDNSQLLWVGTFGGGLGRYDKYRYKFGHFSKVGMESKGLSHKTVSAICEAGEHIWIGTNNGLNKYDYKKKEVSAYYLSNQSISILGIVSDLNDKLWLACGDGLRYFNPSTQKSKIVFNTSIYPDINQDYISAICLDPIGNLWFSVYDEGLFFLPKLEVESDNPDISKIVRHHYSEKNGNNVSANVIWDINCVSENEIWLATNTQIDRFKPNENKFDHFGYNAYSSFFSNQPGVIWVGSLGQGLMKLEVSTGKITHYNTTHGLISDIVQSVEGDSDGNLWISTNKGITMFNPFSEKFKNYDLADGLLSKQYNLNASTKLSTGELVFGCNNGVTIFYPNMIKDNPYPVATKINDIKVLNNSILNLDDNSPENLHLRKKLTPNQELSLNYKDKIVSFSFIALSYSATNKINYAYMLEGFDQEWVYTDANHRTATYTNLEGGKYIFKVKASNPDGIWSNKEAQLLVFVKPPFWKTMLFKILSFLIILVTIILIYRRRIQSVKANALIKYNLEKELREKEVMLLNNEKLDSELDYKKKELALSTLYNIKKNEDLYKLQEELMLISKDVIPKNRSRIQKLIKEVEVSLNENESWAHFEQNFNILHDDFLKRFSTDYPKLTHKDLRICAFIRMNIDNKEIARTLNITPESLGVSRTRIRKKIELDKEIYLNDFILRF